MAKQNIEAKRVTSNIKIEGARLIFKNFQGKKTDFNDEGNRNFGVLLDEDLAEQLMDDGWRVKRLRPREDEEIGTPWLSVKVRYGEYPPIAVLITSRGKTRLDEDTIGQLDWTNIKTVDLIVRPYNYPAMAGRPAGVSAYLKSIYVTANEDDLELKYADLPFTDEEEE